MKYRLFIPRFFDFYIITIFIESITLYIVTKYLARALKKKEYAISDIKTFIILGIIPSSLTLPYLVFVWPFFVANRMMYIVSGEILTVIIEILVLKIFSQYPWKICLLLSLCTNSNSFITGNLLLKIFQQ